MLGTEQFYVRNFSGHTDIHKIQFHPYFYLVLTEPSLREERSYTNYKNVKHMKNTSVLCKKSGNLWPLAASNLCLHQNKETTGNRVIIYALLYAKLHLTGQDSKAQGSNHASPNNCLFRFSFYLLGRMILSSMLLLKTLCQADAIKQSECPHKESQR